MTEAIINPVQTQVIQEDIQDTSSSIISFDDYMYDPESAPAYKSIIRYDRSQGVEYWELNQREDKGEVNDITPFLESIVVSTEQREAIDTLRNSIELSADSRRIDLRGGKDKQSYDRIDINNINLHKYTNLNSKSHKNVFGVDYDLTYGDNLILGLSKMRPEDRPNFVVKNPLTNNKCHLIWVLEVPIQSWHKPGALGWYLGLQQHYSISFGGDPAFMWANKYKNPLYSGGEGLADLQVFYTNNLPFNLERLEEGGMRAFGKRVNFYILGGMAGMNNDIFGLSPNVNGIRKLPEYCAITGRINKNNILINHLFEWAWTNRSELLFSSIGEIIQKAEKQIEYKRDERFPSHSIEYSWITSATHTIVNYISNFQFRAQDLKRKRIGRTDEGADRQAESARRTNEMRRCKNNTAYFVNKAIDLAQNKRIADAIKAGEIRPDMRHKIMK